ncbi:type IV pilin protein [Sapientia aquatica]|uniref:Type IV pilin protein n=1 Tax=Sapientia aquatica TaxID=1549640 RepID=A0A4R5VWP0_9BURK|nr:type IV pilin protein [Sapientia aquatica]TDK63606.1 type IV pilin protein [Sapientia aquatica]
MKKINKLTPQSAITLIELVIALALLSLVATLAFPMYHDAILKVRRTEAKTALYNVMQQQERFYTQKNSYAEFNSVNDQASFKKWSGESKSTSHYELSAQACHGKTLKECVQLTATPIDFNDPICGDLVLDSANNKSYSKGTSPNSACW